MHPGGRRPSSGQRRGTAPPTDCLIRPFLRGPRQMTASSGLGSMKPMDMTPRFSCGQLSDETVAQSLLGNSLCQMVCSITPMDMTPRFSCKWVVGDETVAHWQRGWYQARCSMKPMDTTRCFPCSCADVETAGSWAAKLAKTGAAAWQHSRASRSKVCTAGVRSVGSCPTTAALHSSTAAQHTQTAPLFRTCTYTGLHPAPLWWISSPSRPSILGTEGPQMSMSNRPTCVAGKEAKMCSC